ncbi:SWIM zinc finger family protein [Paenibacillus tengchongensis]|uniref:SWIM zinc finger family protein n=1 Tax=Paenibacillus tengchongensis TaxID=2608684 RepID=UPI001652A091|nr:SWIM zinc finger family protein [Paenibacillus tengchongensis]
MQPNYAMDDAGWDKLVADVAYLFDDLTLKRGFQYYKQQRVHAPNMFSPVKMMALVEGREDYAVVLELDHLSRSRCDCPMQGPCKHMAAALMAYAEKQERSVHLIANAKAVLTRAKAPAFAPPSAAGARVLRQERLNELSGRIAEGSVADWRECLAQLTAPLAHTVRNPAYTERALAAVAEAEPQLAPAARQLFQLHARLFILEGLLRPGGLHVAGTASPLSYSSLGYYTSLAVSELQETITGLLQQPLPLAEEPEAWPRLMDTLDLLRREMLTESRDRSREQPYFSVCYDQLWRGWISPNTSTPQLYLEELDRLREAGSQLGASLSRPSLLLAEARMHALLGEDRAAWERLGVAAERPGLYPAELISFLAPLSEAGEWPRLVEWLAEIGPLFTSRIYNLREYAAYWQDAVRREPAAEPRMWDTLAGMLPLSREIYEDLLLEYGKWREWMDYQLAAGRRPGDFRVSDLAPLEKNAPELLLPFYHQAVERLVLEKNRSSYKAAVKLLKRLAKLYKKLKRTERWEEYLELFAGRHSRLRAFQEELRKGNLLP